MGGIWRKTFENAHSGIPVLAWIQTPSTSLVNEPYLTSRRLNNFAESSCLHGRTLVESMLTSAYVQVAHEPISSRNTGAPTSQSLGLRDWLHHRANISVGMQSRRLVCSQMFCIMMVFQPPDWAVQDQAKP